jgi:hypothetical protein
VVVSDPALTALPDDLADAVTELYRDPPDEFVKHRDALVRELRHLKRRDDADAVKRLRRPERPAWMLDTVFFNDRAALERVAAAVAGVVEAQSGIGNLREATRLLRAAVRDAADVAARVAGAGLASEKASLVRALTAAVADAEAFALLRAGRLGEIPTGGSVDALMRPPSIEVAPLQAVPAPASEPEPADSASMKRARRAVEAAEDTVTAARDDASRTESEVDVAKTSVDAAQVALREAETRMRQERARLQEARAQAKLSRDHLRDAERSLAVARGRLTRLTTPR